MRERRKRPRGRYHRFIDRYEQSQRQRRIQPPNPLKRVARISLGVLLLIFGPIVGALPGPGGLFVVFAGLLILAGEYRRVALVLDRSEAAALPRARRFWHRVRRRPVPDEVEQGDQSEPGPIERSPAVSESRESQPPGRP